MLLFGLTQPITPIQIHWGNMVSSVVLAMALAFEGQEPGLIERLPRRSVEQTLSRFVLWRVGFVSLLFFAGIVGMFTLAEARGATLEEARTIAVNTLVVMEIFYLFSVRFLNGSSLMVQAILGIRSVLIAIAAVTVLQFGFTYTPFMEAFFDTRPVGLADGLMVLAVGPVPIGILEAEKRVPHRHAGAKAAVAEWTRAGGWRRSGTTRRPGRRGRHCAPGPSSAIAQRMTRPFLDNRRAKRLFLDRHLLLRPGSGPGRGADLDGVLDALGFVQVDSVNTLARAHDLILWSRRGRYRPRALETLVARRRSAFEHWTHDAAVIPMAFYPMWRLKFARDEARMRARWPAARREGWHGEIDNVLRHIADHGPACSRDVGGDETRGASGWWDWHPSKTALEFLWRSGRLAVCHRRGFRKFYDLTERVIPAEQRARSRDDDEIVDWAMSEALRRLGFGTSGELAAFFEIATRDEAKTWCAAALSEGRIIEAEIGMADGSRRRSFTTEALLDEAATLPDPTARVRLLSPFDPALRDRARAERLFGFHYRIEIFVPEAKRRYGYYVFPVLQGERVIGRIDARRADDALAVAAFWPESGVRTGKARRSGLMSELDRVARLVGVQGVGFSEGWLRA